MFLLAQTVLTRYARYCSFALGEQVLAELREDFVEQSLALPIGTVERAGTGDLLTRTSRDVEALGWSVRFAVPETIIAFVTTIFTVVALRPGRRLGAGAARARRTAAVRRHAVVPAPRQGGLPAGVGVVRRDQRSVAETAEGARTVEALRLEKRRLERIDADIAESFARRALHAVPADGVVPVGRDRLPAADRR